MPLDPHPRVESSVRDVITKSGAHGADLAEWMIQTVGVKRFLDANKR